MCVRVYVGDTSVGVVFKGVRSTMPKIHNARESIGNREKVILYILTTFLFQRLWDCRRLYLYFGYCLHTISLVFAILSVDKNERTAAHAMHGASPFPSPSLISDD